MADFLSAVATSIRARQCELLGLNEYVVGSVGRINPLLRDRALLGLKGVRRLLGCPPGGDVEAPPPDFLGGQCNALYNVSFSATGAAGLNFGNVCVGENTSTGTLNNVWGPIGGIELQGQGQCSNVSSFERVVLKSRGTGAFPSATPVENTLVAGTTLFSGNITGVSRVDGQPDDCGSLPPTYPPPTNFTTNIDVTYNIDNGDEVTVTIPFVFAPITANFDGSLRIPVTFNLGGIEFSGNVNLPDFSLTLDPLLPPGAGEDLADQGEDAPGETVPPAPPSEKIIGVVVNASQIDSRRVSSYSSPGITPIFVPRLGSIKFAYSIGIATFFSSDIDIKDRRTFIPCPFSQGADAVIASPNIGVNLTFTPIRGFPLATTADIAPA